MRKVYKWAWYLPRNGWLSGIFTAEESEVEAAIGKTVFFGEVLGKHSDVSGKISLGDFTVVTDDAAFVDAFDRFGCSSGYNPLVRLDEQDEDE